MKPRLYEAVMKSTATEKESTRALYETLKQKIPNHPFLSRYTNVGVREGFFSDAANALGMMHDTLVDAAWPELIGRNIINVMPTNQPMERFPLDGGAVAYKYAEHSQLRFHPRNQP